MKLTDARCKGAKSASKPYKIFDGNGLYLEVVPNGSKYWRLKYRFNGKEKKLAIGTYPFYSLAEARSKSDDAKRLIKQNIDPSDNKREERQKAVIDANDTFKVVALEWYSVKSESWSKNYAHEVMRNLNLHIFDEIGRLSINKIDAPTLLLALRKVEKRGSLEVASRLRQLCNQIFRYCIQTGRTRYNPATDLLGALKTPKKQHFAAIEPDELPELIKAIETNEARLFPRTRRAIKLSLLTFLRPGEIRTAEKADFDFVKNIWSIPADRMKKDRDHVVPLSTQAISLIQEQMKEVSRYNSKYLFPSQININIPMSDGTVNIALKRLGFKGRMTAHGFRALARSTIREELNYDPDIIEMQLAHKPSGSLGAAYDRAKFIKQRTVMMQDWADYLDRICLKSD